MHRNGAGCSILKQRRVDPFHYGLRPAATTVKVQDMQPAARQLLQFLIKDLEATKKRHLDGTTGLELLQAATFLDPRFKSHAVFSPEDRSKVRRAVKAMVLKRCADNPLMEQALHNQGQIPAQMLVGAAFAAQAPARRGGGRGRGRARGAASPRPRRSLKRKSSAEEFLFGGERNEPLHERAATVAEQVEQELHLWDRLPAMETLSEETAVLPFWKEHASFFPCLAVLVREVFSIPPSSAQLERLFSAAGRGVTHRRPRLQPGRAADLIFGHGNIALGIRV